MCLFCNYFALLIVIRLLQLILQIYINYLVLYNLFSIISINVISDHALAGSWYDPCKQVLPYGQIYSFESLHTCMVNSTNITLVPSIHWLPNLHKYHSF